MRKVRQASFGTRIFCVNELISGQCDSSKDHKQAVAIMRILREGKTYLMAIKTENKKSRFSIFAFNNVLTTCKIFFLHFNFFLGIFFLTC